MNKKILIGSIIAVVILILVSFTGVVGYQTTKSSTIAKASPLFAVRSSRAIDGESNKDFTCDYVGKGKVTNIFLPKIKYKSESVEILINLIKRMDDKALQKFAYFITYRLHQYDELQQYTNTEIFQSLQQLRDNPDSIIPYMEKETQDTFHYLTSCTCPSIGNLQPLKCL